MQPRQSGTPKLSVGALHVITAAIAITVASLSYATLSQPLQSWRSDLDRRAGLVRAKLALGPAMRSEHVKQTQDLEHLLKRVDEATRQVPDQPCEAEFLADLNRLADEHTIAIEDFQRGAEIKTEGYSAVTVSLRLRGAYDGVCRFVEAVSELPRITELTEMTIRRDGDPIERSVSVTYSLYFGLTTGQGSFAEGTP